jgi:hypothetical protein
MHRRLVINVETNFMSFSASPDTTTTSILSAMVSFCSAIHIHTNILPSSCLLIEKNDD